MKPTISIIGAGGLAVTAAWHLVDKIGDNFQINIFDHDKIELSNLNRQILFSTNDIGKNKAETLVFKLNQKYQNTELKALPYSIDQKNINNELKNSFAVIDATDSARTSFMLNDYCVKNLKLFSYAGVVGTYGQTLLINPAVNSPCLRCIFGNWEEADYYNLELTCQAAGILGPVAGYLGYLQAKLLLDSINFDTSNDNYLTKFNLKDLEIQKIKVTTSRNCINNCYNKNLSELNLSEKECPQTFILSKLALEQIEDNSKLLIAFKTRDNALKTAKSINDEGKKANFVGQKEHRHWIISCN